MHLIFNMFQGEVEIPNDKDFLASCDCTDNCSDRKKCGCVQLTVKATAVDDAEQLFLIVSIFGVFHLS